MPPWISIILKIAALVGPQVLKFIFPNLSKEVWALIDSVLKGIAEAENKPEAVRKMHGAIQECTGTACPTEIKGS